MYKRQVYDGAVDVTVNSVTWTDNGTTPVLTPKGNVQLGSATFTSPAIYMDKVVEIEESDKKAGYRSIWASMSITMRS